MILGLTGKETKVIAPYMVFCNLCSRKINKDEECLSLSGDYKWLAHDNCNLYKEREHKVQFLKDTKIRKAKSKKLKRNR